MTALIIVLSLVGYMGIASTLAVWSIRTAQMTSTYSSFDGDDAALAAFPAMFWPVTAPVLLATGIVARRGQLADAKTRAERMFEDRMSRLDRENARLERDLGIGGRR